MELTPKVNFLGLTFDLTVVIGSLVAAVIVFFITFLATRKREMVPTGMQNLVEMMIDFSRSISRMALTDRQAEKMLAFTFTIFLFILVSNELGILLMVSAEAHGPIPALGITKEVLKDGIHEVAFFKSPTADLSATVAMALSITLMAHFIGIKKNPKSYFKHYWTPMAPIHLIEEITKPLTHAMRLWANIFAGEVLIVIMLTMGPIWLTGAPLIVWMGFSLFVGVIQAFIFSVLANVYIAQKLNPDH